MTITTTNPFTSEKLQDYQEDTEDELSRKISGVRDAQRTWKKSIDNRLSYLKHELRPRLESEKSDFAVLMSKEMGKPISQSIAEVEKCIRLVDYAADTFGHFLENEVINTEASKSYVRFDPLGVVLIVMPWNFPMWQVMRAAVPALAAGNGVVLKHASIVTGTGVKLDEVFNSPLFKTVVARGSRASSLFRQVDGISFTGSTQVGAQLAQQAGRELKKVVLELGGSDPFIVLRSANVESAAKSASFARLQNNGQSCIASKRFIVHDSIFDEFHSRLKDEFSSTIIGDPLETKTALGPLSSMEQTETVMSQIGELKTIGSVEMLGSRENGIVPPTIALSQKKYDEEVFGPVAILKRFKTNEEAVELANETPFGLGASVWGEPDEAETLAPNIEAGMVFVNKMVTSDPRLPFGGVKKSGLGRELSRYGLLEFTNIKSVWVQ